MDGPRGGPIGHIVEGEVVRLDSLLYEVPHVWGVVEPCLDEGDEGGDGEGMCVGVEYIVGGETDGSVQEGIDQHVWTLLSPLHQYIHKGELPSLNSQVSLSFRPPVVDVHPLLHHIPNQMYSLLFTELGVV